MISIKKINDEIVKPIKLKKIDTSKIKGNKLFSELYCNIFICARKKSGKTNVINKIIKECSNDNTNFIFFATTIHKDPNLRKIVKKLGKNGNNVETYMALKENKEDKLQEILSDLKQEESDSDSDSEAEKKPKKSIKFISVDGDSDEEITKKKKRKLAPKYMIIFDDLGNLLKNPNVDTLLKTNRHYKSKVIVSAQYPNDLHPEGIKQMDFIILFKGHPDDKLSEIFKHADIPIDFNIFLKLYKHATEIKYNFLYIDVRNLEFRRNFNYLYEIN